MTQAGGFTDFTFDPFKASLVVRKVSNNLTFKDLKTIDSTSSCLIGEYGTGTCLSSDCRQHPIPDFSQINYEGGDWGLYTQFSPTSPENSWGWIFCKYEYDFSSYTEATLNDFQNWMTSIYNGLKTNTPKFLWSGPHGSTQSPWSAYNWWTDNRTGYSSFDEAKRKVEGATGDNLPQSIILGDDNKYYIRIGSAMPGKDDAGTGKLVYNLKRNNSVTQCDTFRDTNAVYSSLVDAYNMMFSSGPYTSQTVTNPFKTVRFLEGTGFTDWRQSITDRLTLMNSLWPSDGTQLTSLKTRINEAISLPIPEKITNTTVYTVSFQLSAPLLTEYNKSTNKILMLENYLNGLLRDTEATLIVNNLRVTPTTPTFSTTSLVSYTVLNLTDYSTSVVAPNTYPSPNGATTTFFLFATVKATVERWSPMLAIYFSIKGVEFTPDVATLIQTQCGVYLVSAYATDCGGNISSDCIGRLINHCKTRYNPPSGLGKSLADNLLRSDYGSCKCITSNLPPISQTEPANTAAMCFDKNCTTELKNYYRLNDGTCKDFCANVYTWTHAPQNDQNRSANPGALDETSYNRICSSYNPLSDTGTANYNFTVLICSITVFLLITALIFVFCKYKKVSDPITILLSIGILILFAVLTYYLTTLLNGQSKCDYENKRPVCMLNTNKISLEIPLQFCPVILNCECLQTSDCKNGCVCSSGTCTPQTGNRKLDSQSQTTTSIPITTAITISAVTLPLLLYYFLSLYDVYAPLYVLFPVSIVLWLVLFFLVARKTSDVQVLVGECNNCDNCLSDQTCCKGNCCDGGCINDTCVTYLSDCPISTSSTRPVLSFPDALPSGQYSINYGSLSLYGVNSHQNTPSLSLTLGNTASRWNYDQPTQTLSIDSMVVCAVDICDNSTCGNTGLDYKGGLSLLTRAQALDALRNHFILTPTTIYSIDADAYVIPDTNTYDNQTPPGFTSTCKRGNLGSQMTLTYTTDPIQAAVWTIG